MACLWPVRLWTGCLMVLVAVVLTGCNAASSQTADATGALGELGESGEDANGGDIGTVDVAPDTGFTPLTAVAGASRYALVGDVVAFSAVGTRGAQSYRWDFGNGQQAETATTETVYDTPGRYQVVLTVTDAAGAQDAASLVVSVTFPAAWQPRGSSSIVAIEPTDADVAANLSRYAVVSPDSDEVVHIAHGDGVWRVAGRASTCRGPRSVGRGVAAGDIVVVCPRGERLQSFTATDDGFTERSASSVAFPRGSRPFGVAVDPVRQRAFVALQGLGELATIDLASPSPQDSVSTTAALPDARGVALWPDGRVAVSRWRSPSTGGQLALVEPDGGAVTLVTLQIDPQIASDTEVGGVPNYLSEIAVSPQGDEAVLPHTQMNILEGSYRSGKALNHDTVLRAAVSTVRVADSAEQFSARKQFDNRGLASAATWSRRGDYLFVAMRGSQAVERYDRLGENPSGSLLFVGYAPSGLVMSPDDRYLLVDAALSREIVVYDVTDWSTLPQPVARLPLVTTEPLDATLLKGKQLFNDSFDGRLTKDGYLACAHCHLDGENDGQTWDFTDRGEGLRNTPTLLGRAGLGDGPLHWSANFDEVQDFEGDIRAHAKGKGLMSEADFEATADPLGPAKAGLSEDLDALAAYVASLGEDWPSPHCGPDGALSAEALAGKALFESPEVGCSTCHEGPRYTDSGVGLHDVGTLSAASGGRLGDILSGLDTPTLVGVWGTPPYLHDGSAASLNDVLTSRNALDLHGVTSPLTAQQRQALIAYLRCL